MAESFTGKLLVASPSLLDPNFFRGVVLLLEHTEEGALGLVLNRATDAEVGSYLPGWAPFTSQPPIVFVGGPVQGRMAVGLADRPGMDPTEDWNPVLGSIGLIDLSLGPEEVERVAEVRIFAGYAGWGEGQLELELATGSWFIIDATPQDAFTVDPEQLWRTVLKRQDTRLALFADFPLDPNLN